MCCSPWGHKESDTTEQLNDLIWASYTNLGNFGCRENYYLAWERVAKTWGVDNFHLLRAIQNPLNMVKIGE